MEQMIWLAPWVLTELWLSTFVPLIHVVAPPEKPSIIDASRMSSDTNQSFALAFGKTDN
jgi:N-acyl-L-homoserine lactone synthetase